MTNNATSAKYGILLASVFLVLTLLFDGVLGGAVFAALIGLHLLATSWMPWVRLGLRLTTVGGIASGLSLIALASLSIVQNRELVLLPPTLLLPLLLGVVAGPVLLFVDGRSHREAWERWRQGLREASLGDMVLGRHIPHLKQDSRS